MKQFLLKKERNAFSVDDMIVCYVFKKAKPEGNNSDQHDSAIGNVKQAVGRGTMDEYVGEQYCT